MTDLQDLEAESIQIFRDVAAECEKPVMLYSLSKDSSVLLHLASKAFCATKPPFPLLHIDSTWRFREVIAFRDQQASLGLDLIVHTSLEGLADGTNPLDDGARDCTDAMASQAFRHALDEYGFTAAIVGARRDEDKVSANEGIFSVRAPGHRWDPVLQRPEMWNLFNTRLPPGWSMRVFPLSNWTESDIWRYIEKESIPVLPLYFAKPRQVAMRGGAMILVDDDRRRLSPGEVSVTRMVRFRTLGCYPFSGAVESDATTLAKIIEETLVSQYSEGRWRLIDRGGALSMERKKKEGYF